MLCLDADVAGDEATKRGIAVAEKLGVNVEVVTVEGGKDPDEVARAKPELWKKQTKKGLGAYEFLIERAFLMHGVGTGLGKKRITEELVPVLAGIANSVERDHYVKMVAEKLGVREEVVAGEMERLGTVGRVGEDEKKEKGEGEGRGELLEKHVWGLLLSMSGERAVKRWKELGDYRWRIPGLVKMAEAMDGWIEKHNKDFRVKEFVAILPRELLGLMNQVYLAQGLVEMDEEGVEREFGESVEELVRLGVMQRMKGVSREIGELERKKELSDGDEEKLRKLQGEFSELLRSLGVEK